MGYEEQFGIAKMQKILAMYESGGRSWRHSASASEDMKEKSVWAAECTGISVLEHIYPKGGR